MCCIFCVNKFYDKAPELIRFFLSSSKHTKKPYAFILKELIKVQTVCVFVNVDWITLICAALWMDTKQKNRSVVQAELLTKCSNHSTSKIEEKKRGFCLVPASLGAYFCWDLETVLKLNWEGTAGCQDIHNLSCSCHVIRVRIKITLSSQVLLTALEEKLTAVLF